MKFKLTRKDVQFEIAKMNYTSAERERIVAEIDLSDLARCLGSRLEDYAEEWLKEEVEQLLEASEAREKENTMRDSTVAGCSDAINS